MAKKNKKLAFGLIEVMVASSMILMILMALTTATKAALQGNQLIHLRASALFLAQEGLEITRGIRDNNWSGNSGLAWKSLQWSGNTLVDISLTGDSCYKVEYNDAVKSFGLSPIISCPLIGANEGELIEIESDNPDTFYRYIKIGPVGDELLLGSTEDNGENALKMTVYVTYSDNKTVEISEILTNWLPKY